MNSYTWRAAIIRSDLSPTTRHVLLTLSCHINDAGEPTYPSTLMLADECGLSERAVVTHLKLAHSLGWLAISKHGYSGRAWARNEYAPRVPAGFVPRPKPVRKGTEPDSVPHGSELSTKALNDVQCHNPDGTELRSVPQDEALNVVTRGTEPHDIKALNHVQSNYPVELPKELPKTAPAKGKAVENGFASLWAIYPKKAAKADAEKAFAKLKADEAMVTMLLEAIAKQSAWPEWSDEGGKFIPHMATWLNGKRWLDEPAPKQAAVTGVVPASSSGAAWWESAQGIEARGSELEVRKKPGEEFWRYKVRVFKRAGEGKWRDELLGDMLRTKNVAYAAVYEFFYGHPPVEMAA